MKHAEIIEMSLSTYKHHMSGNSFYRTDKILSTFDSTKDLSI